MAYLPLGKLTILIGAGLLGSVIAKEGRLPDVSGLLSGAMKIAFRQIKSDNSSPSVKKPNSDLIAQVNSLRQQLLLMKSNGPVTIITANGGTGAKKYSIIIIIVVVGYGYVWWKGWKLSDMMFATKRSLSDACNTVAQQLDNVYASIGDTRRELSSRVDRVDSGFNEVAEVSNGTHEKVNALRERSTTIDRDIRSVRDVVESMELRISRFEGKQGLSLEGIKHLCDYAHSLEVNMLQKNTQASGSSSRITFSTKVESLPAPTHKPQSPPVSNGNLEIRRPLQHATSTPVQQGSGGISGLADISRSHANSNGGIIQAAERTDGKSSGLYGPTFLHRTRSFMSAVLQRTGAGRQ